jgi:asparagine synthase (glutamine-hydrolysing)
MCGIVGFVAARGVAAPERSGLDEAVRALRHRGPNESGSHVDSGVLLGNTRLSIIDLEGGSQPIWNEDGSVVVVYNGEIWNYRALRERLAGLGHEFATGSDTEVLVHGYEEWGARLPQHLDGMYAFAVWDTRSEHLLLARDRLGKKPLYVLSSGRGLAFGSDARSVFLVSGTKPRVAEDRVAEYLFQRYVVSPGTMFAGVERVEPGHVVEYDRRSVRRSRYWDVGASVETEELEAKELAGLLRAATEKRLMSDVPIGLLLSGGVDSTAVLALARQAGAETLATFTVGFGDPVYDERDRARRAAEHFRTEHHELGVERSAFLEAWPRLAWYRDEPIAEASEIPLLLLSEFAGRHVRVVLSGDGGDEVFGGYPKYRADALLRTGGRVGAVALRAAIAARSTRRTHSRLARAADTVSIRDLELRWVSWFRTMDSAAVDSLLAPSLAREPVAERLATALEERLSAYGTLDDGRRMLLGDLFTYLPDNMLLRSDKVLMGGSLEGRMPLLDAELVRRVSAAPARARSSLLRGKRVLREAVETIVPAPLLGGPKRGFPVPVAEFLAEDGKRLSEQLLLSERCADRGIFQPDAIRAALTGSDGFRIPSAGLFALASFELWARVNVDDLSIEPPAFGTILEDVGAATPATAVL